MPEALINGVETEVQPPVLVNGKDTENDSQEKISLTGKLAGSWLLIDTEKMTGQWLEDFVGADSQKIFQSIIDIVVDHDLPHELTVGALTKLWPIRKRRILYDAIAEVIDGPKEQS